MPVTRSNSQTLEHSGPDKALLDENATSHSHTLDEHLGKQISSRTPLFGTAKGNEGAGNAISRSSSPRCSRRKQIASEQLAIEMKKLEIRQKQLDLEIATLHDEEHSLGGDDDYGDEVMERLEHVKDYVNLLPADRPVPNTTLSSNKTTHTTRRLPELSLVSFDGTPRKNS
ncbi:unnamed protein product [Echinostoma caproni]|uniref:BMERB domain-containing protein n=1 Tax=Echinostoma caproni TaxID=27848 RepID=A0A183BH54_9TREM|nr:unnamed protein product [Echinostoma caproni]